jgi:hypothetical protein
VIRNGFLRIRRQSVFSLGKLNGGWTELLRVAADEQVKADLVVAANWLAVCVGSKAATRVLVYSYAKEAKPVLRLEVAVEGKSNPSVRFDGQLLTIADELTYGEQVRALII